MKKSLQNFTISFYNCKKYRKKYNKIFRWKIFEFFLHFLRKYLRKYFRSYKHPQLFAQNFWKIYFFVIFCLKLWKNYTHWKKIAKFYSNIYYCNFFGEILPIFRWQILHCAKKSRFLRKILQKNIQCKNYRKNLRKNLRKNKRKTFQSHTSVISISIMGQM